ncbi:Alpha-methylacyl-CoA racemase [Geodia barretti]|uniref:Alpha-methylacyl-CoA racemase n=1 Tax=Geodia barretti TaxID=519541 RepID=A0AA35TIZ3_GEOBA|nr:Alpha-methylacyl-CoA racemase [Geodia barretti]
MALRGLRVVEMAGLAPAPLAGMILADFGASVIRVDKTNQPSVVLDTLARNKRSIAVNLKQRAGVEIVQDLCTTADVLLEPYRPGVMEKLGLGPQVCLARNPRLVYARLTGFGQTGSLAHRAGHDINYLAISGVLSMLGRKESNPVPPINLLADFAGGSLVCVVGILMALLERTFSNKGQVVDSAMVDGVAYLSSFLLNTQKIGIWTGDRGSNMLDSGAHFYDTYRTSDGKYMSVGALEPQFYQALLEGLGISDEDLPPQMDYTTWPSMKERFGALFATKTQAQWTAIFRDVDACVEPVLSMEEAAAHPHNRQRSIHMHHREGNFESMPAPKLDRTPASPGSFAQPEVGQHTVEILKELNCSNKVVEELLASNTVFQSKSRANL